MTNTIQNGAEDVYDTFNVIMRRKPKENNFKVIFGYLTKILCYNLNTFQDKNISTEILYKKNIKGQ